MPGQRVEFERHDLVRSPPGVKPETIEVPKRLARDIRAIEHIDAGWERIEKQPNLIRGTLRVQWATPRSVFAMQPDTGHKVGERVRRGRLAAFVGRQVRGEYHAATRAVLPRALGSALTATRMIEVEKAILRAIGVPVG